MRIFNPPDLLLQGGTFLTFGKLELAGIPDDLTAGISAFSPYEDSNQAGRFVIEENDRLMFSESVPDSLQYVQHTNEGTKPSGENKTDGP